MAFCILLNNGMVESSRVNLNGSCQKAFLKGLFLKASLYIILLDAYAMYSAPNQFQHTVSGSAFLPCR